MKGRLLLLASASALWLAWPFLRPSLWPATGKPWIVVLDGYQRLDFALKFGQGPSGAKILLITCPATGQPTQEQQSKSNGALLVLEEGFDTASQVVGLAHWLIERKRLHRSSPPSQIWLVSDRHHFPRASIAAQIAIGSLGAEVVPVPVPVSLAHKESSASVWRDALRMQLWRITGSTFAFLQPALMLKKFRDCQDQL